MSSSYLKISNGLASGAVRIFGKYFAFTLEAEANRQSDKSPTHKIMARDEHGTLKIGVAWERKMQRGEYAGHNMYSLIINDPMFEQEMSFTAFPIDNSGNYDLNFERKRKEISKANGSSDLAPPPHIEEQQHAAA